VSNILAWANLASLAASSFLFTIYYGKSVSPAQLEKSIGEDAYPLCARYRMISSVFMCIAAVNYLLYPLFPLPLPLPKTFPWGWKVSVLIAAAIAIPSGYLMYRGIRDAGEETLRPRKEHCMYGGIYKKIRHPQAVGEFPFWWVLAFLVNSPFLALVSIVYVPVWYYMCRAEEKDLLIRYGDSYAEYMERTGFWWPRGFSRFLQAVGGQFAIGFVVSGVQTASILEHHHAISVSPQKLLVPLLVGVPFNTGGYTVRFAFENLVRPLEPWFGHRTSTVLSNIELYLLLLALQVVILAIVIAIRRRRAKTFKDPLILAIVALLLINGLANINWPWWGT